MASCRISEDYMISMKRTICSFFNFSIYPMFFSWPLQVPGQKFKHLVLQLIQNSPMEEITVVWVFQITQTHNPGPASMNHRVIVIPDKSKEMLKPSHRPPAESDLFPSSHT